MNELRERLDRIVRSGARERALAERREKGYAERRAVGEEEDERSSARAPGTREHARAPFSARPTIGFDVRERAIPLDDLGLKVVGRGACDPGTLAHLGLRGEPPARWEEVVFLDTETTGLAGGTGTYVFLLGTAWIEDGALVLRQHVLHDLGAERAFVRALHAHLDRFRVCASFNGKCFDLPLLRTRVILALRAELAVDASHLDLLHPARRLWRGRFGSTTLRQLEESVLDDGRVDDIPGSLIPERYFRYLDEGDPALLRPILAHNERDILSLVRITDRVALAVIAARAGHAPDHPPAAFALGRALERSGEHEAAFRCYESAYADADLELRLRLALPFARLLERRGEPARALRTLETLLDLGLGRSSWRARAESRVRRLMRQARWRHALAPTT